MSAYYSLFSLAVISLAIIVLFFVSFDIGRMSENTKVGILLFVCILLFIKIIYNITRK